MYLIHLDTKEVVGEGMYCFGLVAVIFKYLGPWWRVEVCVYFFLLKSIFALVLVENTCYKGSGYVFFTKTQNLVSFILTYACSIFSFLMRFISSSFTVLVYGLSDSSDEQSYFSGEAHWEEFAYG